MGFILDMGENYLGLTEEEKAQVAPALPYFKQLIDMLDLDWDEVQQGLNLLTNGKPVFDRLIQDMRVLGPALSAVLGDGMVDFGAMTAGKDVTNTLDANKVWLGKLQACSVKFVPLWGKLNEYLPKILPALNIMIAAARRKGLL